MLTHEPYLLKYNTLEIKYTITVRTLYPNTEHERTV